MTRKTLREIVAQRPDLIAERYVGIYDNLGFDGLYYMAEQFGGLALYIPQTNLLFKDCIHDAIKNDPASMSELCHKYGYAKRTIQRIRSDGNA